MNIPKVSVIVPIYNAEKTLIKCLDSIVAQTYSNIETILVDDGSCDGSKKICELYCLRYNNFRLISQENSGPSTARNNGIDNSNGKYVYFVDADDYIEHKLVETMVKVAEDYSAEMVICNYYIEKVDSTTVIHQYACRSKLYVGEEYRNLCENLIDDTSEKRIPPYSWVRMILRSALENPRMRYKDGIIRSEDFHFFVTLQFRLTKVYVLAEPLYHYVEIPTSITHRYVPDYWKSVKFIYKDLSNLLPRSAGIKRKLDIMLIQRTKIALNNSSWAENKRRFKYEIKEILKDKILSTSINHFTWKEGKEAFGFFYILMKLKIYLVIEFYYGLKYIKRRKRESGFENKKK